MKRKRIAVPVAILVAAGAALTFVLLDGDDDPTALVASGTVEATEARLAFPLAGRIEDVAVQEGDRLEPGREVGRLDQAELRARRGETRAQAAAALARLRELEAGFRAEEVAQARAAGAATAQRLTDAERDRDRTRRLHEGGAVSREAYDKALLDVARSANTQAEEQLRLLERGPRPETIDAQRARLAQAEAAVRALDAALANTTLRSPFTGVVSIRHGEPGESIAPGAPIVTVTNRDDRWVRIYVPEDRLGALETGMPAVIRADTYPSKTYGGEVVFIATEAEFTPKNVQTTEERVKLVYAVKVRVRETPRTSSSPGWRPT